MFHFALRLALKMMSLEFHYYKRATHLWKRMPLEYHIVIFFFFQILESLLNLFHSNWVNFLLP